MSDFSNCAFEPIHVPGAIQPHGCLLSVNADDMTVSQASANAGLLLGRDPADLLGKRLQEVFPLAAVDLLARALQADTLEDVNPWVVNIGSDSLEAIVHGSEGDIVIEFEAGNDRQRRLEADGLEQALTRLARCQALADLLNTTASVIRELTGFDRIVVYQFDTESHGEVVAEARDDAMETFLGMRFPESDIPKQARDLYLRTWSRSIVDARYQPVPLVPALRPGAGTALDLSSAQLRSVSPVHLEYLANMGVQASMSISLIVAGRLWGLISGGHRTPHQLHYRLRRACEIIGRVVSLEINSFDAREFRRRQQEKALCLATLVACVEDRQAPDVLDGLEAGSSALLALTEATGAGLIIDERVVAVGTCPPAPVMIELAGWLRGREMADGLFETSSLGAEDTRWVPMAEVASGLLAVLLPSATPQCVLWFRPEIVGTVNWGGNPNKAKQVEDTEGGVRLHPRRSFALWREVVRGKARRWDLADRHGAESLRRRLVELDLKRQILKERAAVGARDEMVAIVSHDLRTPMSVVVMQAALIQRMILASADGALQRFRSAASTIQRAGQRMSALLHDLLDLAKIDAGRFVVVPTPQPADQLVRDAIDLMEGVAAASQVTLAARELVDDLVEADPERVFQVLSNLIGNAIKYAPAGSQVEVGVARTGSVCEFRVSDRGPGIARDQLDLLFQRFWQGNRGDASGVGLGLYIARGIVQAHGGAIWADSVLGEGTTMIFTLPLAREPVGGQGLAPVAITK